MKKKLFTIVSLLLVLSFVLTACGPKTTPTSAPTKAAPAATKAPAPTKAKPKKKFKVGLVTDVGGVNDKSFNQSAWKGVQRAIKELGVEGKYIESKQVTDYEKNIDAFATEGYDMIITVGFLMGDATKKKAKEYPNIKFAIVDYAYKPEEYKTELKNVTSLLFAEDQVGFLAGVLAGCMSKTGVIGSVAGMEIPPVVRYVTGYQNGAKSVNPNIKTLNQYIPSFTDPAKGKEVGLSMIEQGADVIFGVGGNTGNGGLLAAKEKGKMGIGVDVDQYYTYPEVKDILITSAMKNVDVAVFDAIKAAVNGQLKPGIMLSSMKNGGIGLAPYHEWENKIPQKCKDLVKKAEEGLKNGTIDPKKVYKLASMESKPAKKFKVGLVTDVGGVNDKSFNQSAWAGVQRAIKELGIEGKYIESKQVTDYEKNIDAFATEGYDMIITVGFLMGDATKKKAKEYPNIKFAIVDYAYKPEEYKTELKNVTSLLFAEDQVGFLAGVLAGCMSKTGVIGSVAGMEIPPVVRYVTGYQNGAKSVNPNIKTLNQYIPSFTDPAKGKEVGLSMIEQGADVIFGVGGNTGNGGLLAAKEKGKMGIGVDVDQYYTYPEVKDILITSAMKNVDVAVFDAIKAAVNGQLKPGIMLSSMKNGGIGLAPYHEWENKIPQKCKDLVKKAEEGLKNGTIDPKKVYNLAEGAAAAKPTPEVTPKVTTKVLHIYNWSDYIDPEVYKLFEKRTGIKIVEDTFSSNEELLAKLQAGATGYDLIVPSDYMVDTMVKKGMLATLDKSLIPNMKNIDPKFANPPYDPGLKHCIPYQWGTTGIGYLDNKVKPAPTSWDDIFNPDKIKKYKGQITMLDDEREVIGAALKYLGYSLNDTDPKHLEQAKEVLIKQKPYLHSYDSDQFEDLLAAEETVLAHGYSGDFLMGKEDNEHIQYVVPKEGGTLWVDNVCIPATSKNKVAAEMFMNFILQPKIAAMISNYNHYASPDAAAFQYLDDDLKNDPAVYPPKEVMERLEIIKNLGDAEPLWDKIWTEVKSK